jgi:flagellar basal body-associated protein FliL
VGNGTVNKDFIALIVRFNNKELSVNELHQFNEALKTDVFLSEAIEGLSQLKTNEFQSDIIAVDFVNGKIRKGFRLQGYTLWIVIAVIVIVGLLVLMLQMRPFGTKAKSELPTTLHHSPTVPIQNDTQQQPIDTFFVSSEFIEESVDAAVRPMNRQTEEKVKQEVKQAIEVEDMQVLSTITPKLQSNIKIDAEAPSIVNNELIVNDNPAVDVVLDEKEGLPPLAGAPIVSPQVKKGLNADPKPLGGDELFSKYISENTNLPQGIEVNRRLVVRVEFSVTTSGNPININVTRGATNDEITKEVIRLINNGPRWSPGVVNGVPVEKPVSLRLVLRP